MLVPNMTHALTLNTDFLIAGDLNCNLLSSNVDSSSLRGLCENFNLKQLITSPTRVSRHHESLIDVIISSNPTLIKDSGVKEITISDHFLVYAVLNLRKQKPRKSIMNVRVFKTYVPDNFSSDIAQVPWQAFDFSSDIDEKVATFNNLFLNVLNQHAPVKQITVEAKPIPFMTSELLLQINERNRLLKVARSTRNILDWEIYKSSRRQVKSSLS